MDPNYYVNTPCPWLEAYYSDGVRTFRLYARMWRVGDDPYQDGKRRVVLQPVVGTKVLAEAIQPKDVEWVEIGQEKSWAKKKLGPSYRELTKTTEKIPGRPHTDPGRFSV